MSKPSGTNSPTSSSVKPFRRADCEYETELEGKAEETSLKVHKATAKDSKVLLNQVIFSQDIYCGGYSGEDPPLPIPNREVKLTIADGTAIPGGRVGSRHFLIQKP